MTEINWSDYLETFRVLARQILDWADSTLDLFTVPIGTLANPFAEVPVVGQVLDFLISAGGILPTDVSILGLMIGVGVPAVFVLTVVKWVIGIIS